MAAYVPRQGDLVTLTFDRQSGHEQQGRRPALVVSKDLFNAHTGLCIVCPVTSSQRDYPFHISIPAGQKVSGFVMVEQVKSIDFRFRKVRRIAKAPAVLVEETLSILDACIY